MLRSIFLYLAQQKKLERCLLALPGAQRLAHQFVAGETLAQAVKVVRGLNQKGILATLDHLGENVRTPEEAAAARDDYRRILQEIAREQLQSTISVKLTQLGLDISESACRINLKAVTEEAERTDNLVQVDMESSAHTDRTLAILIELHQSCSAVGAVIQAYLYRSEDDVQQLIAQGIRIRLCKGAYKEPSSLAYPHKSAVDENFLHLMRLLLASRLYHSIATHDPRMIEATCRYAQELCLSKDSFEFQMLNGVRRDLQNRLIAEGYRLRIYVPFGKQWFPYFMRRLAERPANVWFAAKNLWR
ncbi:MAG: proline dehydrogenase [Acidobacteria bacterium RIFCSPLOWO2_12_FULL_59_11]|nr:MAG: proline dehydrogenase [Acidobacteria bacterium RIFCSPLOWO2_12_FULL_59_11]